MEAETECVLSSEETDLLSRSNKKVKVGCAGTESSGPFENIGDESPRRKFSYRDMVMGEASRGQEQYLSGLSDFEEVISDDDEDDSECPTIKLSCDEKVRLRSTWARTLIIKLIGRAVGFKFLERRLLALWRIESNIDVVDVGNDCYLVRFSSVLEYERALTEGPWIIADHYLAVSKWYPNFDPDSFTISKLTVWVHFPNLPMEYFDEAFLQRLGQEIGKPLKVDDTTLAATRGKYARICVEVDLEKPLISKFRLRRRVRRIEYEAMHLIYFQCGKYGHRKEECQTSVLNKPCDAGDTSGPVNNAAPVRPEIIEAYGQWMVASRNNRRKSNSGNQGKRDVSSKQSAEKSQLLGQVSGSRFSVLDKENTDVMGPILGSNLQDLGEDGNVGYGKAGKTKVKFGTRILNKMCI